MRLEPWTKPAMCSKEQHKDKPGHHRGNGERQINEGDKDILARKLELGYAPGGSHAEHQI